MFYHSLDPATDLRLLAPHHAQEWFAVVDAERDHIRAWMRWVDYVRTLLDAQQHIQSALERYGANNGCEVGIWFNGALAGCLRFNAFDWAHRTTTLGYWARASAQGHGLVTKACRALITHAFRDLGLNRVEIHCARGNQKSRAIPQRLGFAEEGVLRQAEWLGDRFDDVVVYGLLAHEWSPAAAC